MVVLDLGVSSALLGLLPMHVYVWYSVHAVYRGRHVRGVVLQK